MDTLQDILDDKGPAVYATAPHATLAHAVETMCGLHVGSLLVVEDGLLDGILSERDVLQRVLLGGLDAATTPVWKVMTSEVLCVEPDLRTSDAMAIMTEQRVRHLPVGRPERVVGVVSIGDLVRWAIRDREHTIATLEAYVEGRYPG